MFGKHTWVNMVLGWFYWLCLFVLNMFASHGDGYLQHTLIFLHIMMTKLSTRGLVIRWARRGKDSWLIIDLERRFLFHYRSNDTLQLMVAISTCGVEEFIVTNTTLNGATKILSHTVAKTIVVNLKISAEVTASKWIPFIIQSRSHIIIIQYHRRY